MRLRGIWMAISRPTTAGEQDRESEERIDRERNPVLLLGREDLEDLQQADASVP